MNTKKTFYILNRLMLDQKLRTINKIPIKQNKHPEISKKALKSNFYKSF